MIYLDNAATSFPKPARVSDEMLRCMRQYCGNPGRGSHALAMEAAERIYACREEAAAFFGVSSPENVIFTPNTTVALNMAVKGLLRQGDHVLLSDMEHNAVYRPVQKLKNQGRITFDVFPSLVTHPEATVADLCMGIAKCLRPNTRMLICTHASNICSWKAPLRELGAFCRRHGLLFVVDAAQSAGHEVIDMKEMAIDALCVPGHKGLLGPQGSGMLLLGDGIMADTLLEGGSGYNSLDAEMPLEAPERYEAGTLATPAIVGLCEGIREVKRLGVASIARHIAGLNARLQNHLRHLPGVRIYAPQHSGAVLLFGVEGISADGVGDWLNRCGFCVRAGYHCSALGHTTLNTPPGGAVRVSPGIYNTKEQMDHFASAVEELLKK
ncbi:MAG: aminotransferase class V-fold PLP-dependent enzyme [Clostridia bacterium]|nr:aminotransferase class V-fold PLP-dependent enzyme [Clostridia bacterium]